MTTKNFEEYRVDNLLDIQKPEVASEVLDIVKEYLSFTELLFDGFKVFRQLIKQHQKKHKDKFIKGFSDKEKLKIPVLIQTFTKSLRFKLGKRTNNKYVKVGSDVKCLSIISIQSERLIEESDYVIKLILIQTFKPDHAIEQINKLLKVYEESIDCLTEIKRVPEAVLFEHQARLN